MTQAVQKLSEAFDLDRGRFAASGNEWLDRRRDEAMADFVEAGLPHRRLEDWRYTDLARVLESAILSTAPLRADVVELPKDGAAIRAFGAIDRHVVVFVNGDLRLDLSEMNLPEGVTLTPSTTVLSQAWAQALVDEPVGEAQAAQITALNTGLMRGGMALHVAANTKLEKPLHLIYLAADEGAAHMRNLVQLERGAEATVYESYVGAGATSYFSDIVTNVSLAEDANLTHIKVQDEASGGIHLSTMSAVLEACACLSSFTLSVGGALSRCQSFVRFAGEGGEAHVNGATALNGRQHGDQFCVVDHAVPHCSSNTLFRTVLDGASTGVFQGKVIVRPHAQKTDGRQMSNALLLSRDAAMNAKPELEIYADDVQCAHGSTIGELNREALFYLRSRGIDEQTARQLLISAFLDEAFETVPDGAARDGLRELAADWFRLTLKEDA